MGKEFGWNFTVSNWERMGRQELTTVYDGKCKSECYKRMLAVADPNT
jgi:hypothetical protein